MLRATLILTLACLIIFGSLLILAYGQGFAIRAATVPTGSLIMVKSGSCPAGFSEDGSFDGVTVLGTRAFHGNVGTTGGSDDITPAGTVAAPILTMNSYTPGGSVAAPTFTGTSAQATSAVSAGTPAGSNGSAAFTPSGTIAWPVGVPAFSGNAGTVPAQIFTGSSGTVPAQTISWPAGVPTAANESAHTHSVTAAGTNGSVTITPLGTNAASATSGNCAATNVAIGTSTLSACKATAPNLTVTAQTFTGSSTTVGAQTFTGSAVTSGAGSAHTHTLAWPVGVPTNGTAAFTPAGTNGTAAFTPAGTNAWPAGVPSFSGSGGTVPAQTFTGSALGTHSHTLTPGGTNSAPAFTGTPATPTGSNSTPAFTGSSFDNRSAFIRVIFCTAN